MKRQQSSGIVSCQMSVVCTYSQRVSWHASTDSSRCVSVAVVVQSVSLSSCCSCNLKSPCCCIQECSFCEDARFARTGVCISCDAGMCRSYFHVTCAQREGLLSEAAAEEVREKKNPAYSTHSDILLFNYFTFLRGEINPSVRCHAARQLFHWQNQSGEKFKLWGFIMWTQKNKQKDQTCELCHSAYVCSWWTSSTQTGLQSKTLVDLRLTFRVTNQERYCWILQ